MPYVQPSPLPPAIHFFTPYSRLLVSLCISPGLHQSKNHKHSALLHYHFLLFTLFYGSLLSRRLHHCRFDIFTNLLHFLLLTDISFVPFSLCHLYSHVVLSHVHSSQSFMLHYYDPSFTIHSWSSSLLSHHVPSCMCYATTIHHYK